MAKTQLDVARQQLEAAIQALSAGDALATTDSAPGQGTPQPAAASPDTIETLTRLVLGASLLGLEELERRGPRWERQAAGEPAEDIRAEPGPPAPGAAAGAAMRQALAGWVFAAHDRLRDAADATSWLRAASAHLLDGAAALTGETLRTRGGPSPRSQDLARWIARGQAEEERSKGLARVALAEIVRDSVTYLAHEEAVQELVQRQSTGLVEEALDEVRERAVSGDVAVSRFVGRLLRRRPELVLPPAELAPPEQAEGQR